MIYPYSMNLKRHRSTAPLRRSSGRHPAFVWLMTALLVSGPTMVLAQDAEQKGLEIAEAVQAQDDGFIDSESNMTMTLINRAGDQSVRKIRTRVLEVSGDGDKSLTIFDEPADIKGTASLTYSHATEPDEQWLYLPALKRVKRISSKNKSGPFMGSEFAFEDISSQEVEKYTYTYLEETELDGIPVHRIEAKPAYKHSGYSRLINYIDKEKLVAVRVEYFDRKNSALKTLTLSDFKKYQDRFWRPHRMEMNNQQTGKSTILEWSDYQFATGLTDKDFDKNAIKRIR